MSMIKSAFLRSAAAALVVLPCVALAHHSRAYFPDEFIEVRGELMSVDWRNPHIVFTLKDGEDQTWHMEAGSIYMLLRSGVTKDLFAVGDQVLVAGHESTRTARDFLATNMLFADGREALVLPAAAPRWSDDRIGGRDQWVADEARLESVEADDRGIFQVWSIPQGNAGSRQVSFTEKAIAGRASFDLTDNFATRCEQPGMPRIMLNPHPFEFIDEGASIRVLGEEYDMVRVIHIDDAADPQSQATNNMGYSVGRWEGNTLIVETSRIDWPYFDGGGTPQSADVETVETFVVSQDQERLDYRITITDPVTLTEPAVIERYWLALGETVEPFECQVF